MQKLKICFFISAFICLSQQVAFAAEADSTAIPSEGIEAGQPAATVVEDAVDTSTTIAEDDYMLTQEEDTSSLGKDIFTELIFRPVSVVGSVTGLAIFVVASPVSGLASIPEPHDAFEITWNDFVVTPYHFAFRRPFGDYSVELQN